MIIQPLPAFNDNYIWILINDDNNQAWVVDPGDAEVVLTYLQQHHLTLNGILLTHHHFDHTGGVERLKQRWNCPVIGPAQIAGVTQPVYDSQHFSLFGLTVTVIATPAHTLDHLCYFVHTTPNSTPWLFCGDTLFRGGCGRLMEGTAAQMLTALSRLSVLPDNTLVYCTHEYTLPNYRFACSLEPENPELQHHYQTCSMQRQAGQITLPSSIAIEKATNPFLRTHNQALVARAAQQLNEPIATDKVAAFAQVRRAKDVF